MWTGSSVGNCHSNFLQVNNSLRATYSTSANTNIASYYKSSKNSSYCLFSSRQAASGRPALCLSHHSIVSKAEPVNWGILH